MRRQTLLSISGIAAAIVVAAVLLFPGNATPRVEAAMIIQKLSKQIEQGPLFDITLEKLHIDEVYVNGRLQASRQAVAGDIELKVQEGKPEQHIEVDLALGISNDGGWVLIRKLTIPDPSVQAILACVFPQGSETLIVLPPGQVDLGDVVDLDEEMEEARSELMQVFDELLAHHEEYGATIEKQPDGTILLTLPIKSAETIAALERLTEPSDNGEAMRNMITITKGDVNTQEEGIEIEIDEADELIGTTITVLYDPAADRVRSFAIHDFGSPGSRIAITIGEGEIDPALLDSSRVTTPDTRTFDLGALESMFKDVDD